MGVKRFYEDGYWIVEDERIIGLKFNRERVASEFFNVALEETVTEWKAQNQQTFDRTLWRHDIEEARSIFLEKIKKVQSHVYWTVFNFVNKKRLNTLFRKDYANIENISSQQIDWIIERNENGAVEYVSIDNTIVRPPSLFGPSTSTPEQVLQDKEFHNGIRTLVAIIKASKRKHSSTYVKILEMELFDGIHVTSVHGSVLGIPAQDVADLRFQAFKFAQKTALKRFPEFAQMIENLKREREHKKENIEVEREERIPLHGPIKLWRRGKGEKIIPYEKALKIQERLKRWREKGLIKVRRSEAYPLKQTNKG